jgi:hypothetical protein
MNSSIGVEGSIDDMLLAIKQLLEPTVVSKSTHTRKGESSSFFGDFDPATRYHPRLSSTRNKPSMMEYHGEESKHYEQDAIIGGYPGFNSRTPWWEMQAPYNTMTLPDVFKLLETVEEDRVICVKKIHKLGFKSVKILRQYFSQYGVVTRIVVLPSRQKEVETYDGSVRLNVRPASMCFVVMASEAACREILMHEVHYVGYEWPVEVSSFNRGGAAPSSPASLSVSISSSASPIIAASY